MDYKNLTIDTVEVTEKQIHLQNKIHHLAEVLKNSRKNRKGTSKSIQSDESVEIDKSNTHLNPQERSLRSDTSLTFEVKRKNLKYKKLQRN
ncbi:MAG: hypothetical protein HWD61_06635 [Parachlamydiaceae bacterium]|nr:MAG: hypothetical protein HWD61_06635 [Parachlamydiaceae bacterium]